MKFFIERNKHPAGRLWNILFGLASLVDGLVRALSLGFCHTVLPITVARYQAKALHKRYRKRMGG